MIPADRANSLRVCEEAASYLIEQFRKSAFRSPNPFATGAVYARPALLGPGRAPLRVCGFA
ncbi:MAG: hypothetical protein LC808_24880, partial [Actinobacteria bacterium]|nr:hypothetical protein [Actinomycetota bacterium]